MFNQVVVFLAVADLCYDMISCNQGKTRRAAPAEGRKKCDGPQNDAKNGFILYTWRVAQQWRTTATAALSYQSTFQFASGYAVLLWCTIPICVSTAR